VLRATYKRLRGVAAKRLRRKNIWSIRPTDLFHSAYARGGGWATETAEDSGHFIRLMSHLMRKSLAVEARADHALKRNAGKRPAPLLFPEEDTKTRSREDTAAVTEALRALQHHDAGCEQAVRLHVVRGHTLRQTADDLGVTIHRVRVDVEYGLAWLNRRLSGGS